MIESAPQRRLVCIGKIVGVWGVDGWVKIHSYTQSPADIFQYGRWLLESAENYSGFELESGHQQGRGLVAKLSGIEDRDSASILVGMRIHIGTDQLPMPVEGEFFWHQLEGLQVETLDGTLLGVLDHLFETGANDVMVVAGGRERLIPYVENVVRGVDLAAGIIRVDWDPDF